MTKSEDAALYRMPARARYQMDVEFHQLVDTMHAMIERSQFSPSELREAAVLAAVMYEDRQAKAVYMRRGDDGGIEIVSPYHQPTPMTAVMRPHAGRAVARDSKAGEVEE